MTSVQTLELPERRLLAGWAAACAARVLPIYEAEADDPRVRDAVERAERFARGELDAAGEIRRRLEAGRAAHAARTAAGRAAARAAAQAAAVAHMGAHALGAAGYAVRARALAEPDRPDAAATEIAWQLAQLTGPARRALRALPAVGTHTSGPLGPGLLASGALGEVVRELQARVAAP